MPNPRGGDSFTWLVIILGAALLFVGFWPYLVLRFGSPDPPRNQPNCLVNLHLLRQAALAYAADYDDRLPRKPVPGGDWMVWNWSMVTVSKRGYSLNATHFDSPVAPYTRNFRSTLCPDDPSQSSPDFAESPHSSYTWNNALCGKLAKDLSDQPLLWNRATLHDHGRNVASVGGKPVWVAEEDFVPRLSK